MGALPRGTLWVPRDLSLGADPEGKRKDGRVEPARPSVFSPWNGARVGSHRCPVLRSGRLRIPQSQPNSPAAKEPKPDRSFCPSCGAARPPSVIPARPQGTPCSVSRGRGSPTRPNLQSSQFDARQERETSQAKGWSYPRHAAPASPPGQKRSASKREHQQPRPDCVLQFFALAKNSARSAEIEVRRIRKTTS